MAAVQRSTYTPPDNLANHVSPVLMEDVKKTLPAVGLPIEYAQAMRPDLLAMTIAIMEMGRHGYDANLGLDMHFARLAKREGKRIVELESIAGQMALLDSFSPELQEAMLRTTVDGVRDGSLSSDTHKLVSAWSAGDSARLLDQVDKEVDDLPEKVAAEMRERLYDARNREMADKISVMLAGADPTFVAVGTGHLLGDTGIVELLRRKGFAIRRL
jgi:uncharacterized protein YbaP (TraB family)